MNARLSRPGRRLFSCAGIALALCTAISVLPQPSRALAGNLMAVQPDGRIVVANGAWFRGGALARYLPDGSLDPSFGDGGIAVTERLGWFSAMSLQPDGRILAASLSRGGSSPAPSIGRFLADGSPDPSFGSAGRAVEPAAGVYGAEPTTIVAEPDGRIVVASNVYAGKYKATTSSAVTAFSAAGQFERTLLKLFSPSLSASNTINDILPGSGIAVGSHPDPGSGTTERQLVLRLQGGTPAGYEPGFAGGQGLSLGREGQARAVAADQSGNLVTVGAGYEPYWQSPPATVSRYDANGILDPGFGVGGNAELAIPGATGLSLEAVSVAADGSIVVAGRLTAMSSQLGCYRCTSAVVARFTPGGQLDPAFGAGGVVILGSSRFPDGRLPDFGARDLALLGDGSILIFGTAQNEPSAFVLARLTSGGELDPTFSDDGVVTTYTCPPPSGASVQRGCQVRPRVSLRVQRLRSRKPLLKLEVLPLPSAAQIESVELVLPRALRLHPGRIKQSGGMKAMIERRRVRPASLTPRSATFTQLQRANKFSLTLWRGSFRAARKLGPRQRLGFKVIVKFDPEGEGPETVVLHRRP